MGDSYCQSMEVPCNTYTHNPCDYSQLRGARKCTLPACPGRGGNLETGEHRVHHSWNVSSPDLLTLAFFKL